MKTQTLTDRVYEGLLDRIQSGRMEPGERLIIDRIAREFDVSLIPVREALARLNEHGVLRYVMNKGYQVAPAPTLQEYEELFRARLGIEYGALHIGFDLIGAAEIDRLQEINEAIGSLDPERRDPETFERFTELNAQFHSLIVGFAASGPLMGAYARTGYGPQIGRKMYQHGAPDVSNNYEEHVEILGALRAGNKAQALDNLELHIRSGMQRFLQWFPGNEVSDPMV